MRYGRRKTYYVSNSGTGRSYNLCWVQFLSDWTDGTMKKESWIKKSDLTSLNASLALRGLGSDVCCFTCVGEGLVVWALNYVSLMLQEWLICPQLRIFDDPVLPNPSHCLVCFPFGLILLFSVRRLLWTCLFEVVVLLLFWNVRAAFAYCRCCNTASLPPYLLCFGVVRNCAFWVTCCWSYFLAFLHCALEISSGIFVRFALCLWTCLAVWHAHGHSCYCCCSVVICLLFFVLWCSWTLCFGL